MIYCRRITAMAAGTEGAPMVMSINLENLDGMNEMHSEIDLLGAKT